MAWISGIGQHTFTRCECGWLKEYSKVDHCKMFEHSYIGLELYLFQLLFYKIM